jgi:hypothetical protein
MGDRMSALSPIMASAPFAEHQPAELRGLYDALREQESALLRLPFTADVSGYTRDIDEDIVRDAAATVLDAHLREWQHLAAELQHMRDVGELP